MKFNKVVVIGCGGIWSYLRPLLCKILSFTPGAPISLVLVDGDEFDFSNLDRQDMKAADDGRKKAEVFADKIMLEYPKLHVQILKEYLTEDNVKKVDWNNALVLSCVDNHPTRLLLAKIARTKKNMVLISGASDFMKGNAHAHIVNDGKELTFGIDVCHPEIATTKEMNPGKMTCEMKARLPRGGQHAISNSFTATIMSKYVFDLLKGGTPDQSFPLIATKSETFYDLDNLVMDTTSRMVPLPKAVTSKKRRVVKRVIRRINRVRDIPRIQKVRNLARTRRSK